MGIGRILGVEPDKTASFSRGDVEGYVAADSGKFLVAFRGSEPPTSKDVIHDRLRDLDAVPVLLRDYVDDGPPFARIHQGFADGVHDVIAPLLVAMHTLNPEGNLPLWITGHSLGGVLAVVAASFFRFDSQLRRDVQGLYTFGQPRVAGPGHALEIDRELGNRYQRVVNRLDIVPRLPPRGLLREYADAGVIQWLDEAGYLHTRGIPRYDSLLAVSLQDLLSGRAEGNPFAATFAAFKVDLADPVTDHLLRMQLFPAVPKENLGSYLCKLAHLAGQGLPASP